MTDEGIDAAGLIAAAADQGFKVSHRSLELWRYRGLLPRGRRSQGRKAGWVYPAHTQAQLLRLLHWRQLTRRLDSVLIALWVDGFEVSLDHVRAAMIRIVDSISREMLGVPSATNVMPTALDQLAHKLASKRGRGSLPRVVRMTAAERTRAVAFMLAHLLGIEEEVTRRAGDRVLLERMFGLRSGHGGGLATPLGIDRDPPLIPRLPSPPRLRQILNTAGEEELEFARRVAHVLVVWAPLLLPSFIDEYGAKAGVFRDVMNALGAEPGPEYHAFAVIALLMAVHAQTPSTEELLSRLETFTLTAVNLELLAGLPAERRRDAFKRLSPPHQDQVAGELATRRVARPKQAEHRQRRDGSRGVRTR